MYYFTDSFLQYNPFTDSRFVPKNATELFKYPEIPEGLRDSVIRAKRHFDQNSFATSKKLLPILEKVCSPEFGAVNVIQSARLSDLNYIDDDEVVRLAAYLENPEFGISLNKWPQFYALLSLAAVGKIHQYLWPSSKFLDEWKKAAGVRWEEDLEIARRTDVPELARIAEKAVGQAERFQEKLSALEDDPIRKKNRENAKKTHAPIKAIFARYVDWACSLPPDHGFKSKASAAAFFINSRLDDNERRLISATSNRTMNELLNKHCLEQKLSHPFTKTAQSD